MSCLTQIAWGFAYKAEQQFLVLKAVLMLFFSWPVSCMMKTTEKVMVMCICFHSVLGILLYKWWDTLQ